MKTKRWIYLGVVLIIVMSISSCLPGDGSIEAENPAGFFWGVWHGWVAPISLIGSLFTENIRVYEVINSGFWYDLGFYMAIVSGFGGLGFARGRKKRQEFEE